MRFRFPLSSSDPSPKGHNLSAFNSVVVDTFRRIPGPWQPPPNLPAFNSVVVDIVSWDGGRDRQSFSWNCAECNRGGKHVLKYHAADRTPIGPLQGLNLRGKDSYSHEGGAVVVSCASKPKLHNLLEILMTADLLTMGICCY